MPAKLVHGQHIHFIDGSNNSKSGAIRKIQKDKDYRENLENQARQYYLKHLRPEAVILKINVLCIRSIYNFFDIHTEIILIGC